MIALPPLLFHILLPSPHHLPSPALHSAFTLRNERKEMPVTIKEREEGEKKGEERGGGGEVPAHNTAA